MSNNAKNNNVTVETVAAKAAEEKLVVPPQAEGEKDAVTDEVTAEQDVKLEALEGGKKSLKDRVTALKAKCGEHQKALLALAAASAVTSVVLLKYFAKMNAQELEMSADETVEDTENENTTEESGS